MAALQTAEVMGSLSVSSPMSFGLSTSEEEASPEVLPFFSSTRQTAPKPQLNPKKAQRQAFERESRRRIEDTSIAGESADSTPSLPTCNCGNRHSLETPDAIALQCANYNRYRLVTLLRQRTTTHVNGQPPPSDKDDLWHCLCGGSFVGPRSVEAHQHRLSCLPFFELFHTFGTWMCVCGVQAADRNERVALGHRTLCVDYAAFKGSFPEKDTRTCPCPLGTLPTVGKYREHGRSCAVFLATFAKVLPENFARQAADPALAPVATTAPLKRAATKSKPSKSSRKRNTATKSKAKPKSASTQHEQKRSSHGVQGGAGDGNDLSLEFVSGNDGDALDQFGWRCVCSQPYRDEWSEAAQQHRVACAVYLAHSLFDPDGLPTMCPPSPNAARARARQLPARGQHRWESTGRLRARDLGEDSVSKDTEEAEEQAEAPKPKKQKKATGHKDVRNLPLAMPNKGYEHEFCRTMKEAIPRNLDLVPCFRPPAKLDRSLVDRHVLVLWNGGGWCYGKIDGHHGPNDKRKKAAWRNLRKPCNYDVFYPPSKTYVEHFFENSWYNTTGEDKLFAGCWVLLEPRGVHDKHDRGHSSTSPSPKGSESESPAPETADF